jgi:hypothetical protein
MRTITYGVTLQTPHYVYTEPVTVTAKDLNSGAGKALRLALRDLPKDHEFVKIEFVSAL